jgi:hypothetical protein
MKCSLRFRLYISENHISIDISLYEKIQLMVVCCVCAVILHHDWGLVT